MTDLAIKSFMTLLVVMDPVALVPMYLALGVAETPESNRRVATRAVLVAGSILVVFAVAGVALLEHLGISLHAFRIAGGILLFKIALDMVFAQRERETEEEEHEARERDDISVFPLGIPLLAGPGAMASVMILAGEARAVHELGLAVVLGCVAAVLILSWVALFLAGPLSKVLGQTGINVITRILGVLLAALAVQYVADGSLGFLQ